MDFFPILYILIQLLLLAAMVFTSRTQKNLIFNLLATLNLMLCFYGLYLLRVFIGLVQFFRPIIRNIEVSNYASTSSYLEPIMRIGGMVFLPLLFLIPWCRKSILCTIFFCIYIIWNVTPNYGDQFEIVIKIFFCISLFAATYGVLWFFKKLPSQTAHH